MHNQKQSWVWIGTNDVIFDNCRADQVVAGTVAIVRELRRRRPDAWVVVQSLLPSESAPWSVILDINEATRCLTDSTKNAFFYNSSNVFMMPRVVDGKSSQNSRGDHVVNASRFVADGIHPNGQGARAHARSMIAFLRKISTDRYFHY